MKFRFAALFVGLLLATSVICNGNSTSVAPEASSSTVAASSTGAPASTDAPASTAAPGSTVLPGSTVSSAPVASTNAPGSTVSSAPGASTNAPGSTVSSAPGASTNAPGSTVSSAPGASTNAPGSTVTGGQTTVGGSTVSSGPTTQAPLPKFGSPVCVDSTCTYELDAPQNNQAVLATDQSIVQADRKQFVGLQTAADGKDAQVKAANDAAVAKIKHLQDLMDQIQTNMNTIQTNMQKIQSQQNDALVTLSFVESFISSLNGGKDTCLYEKCLKPTTPAPPTTTPTPAPTTTPNPCPAFSCPVAPTGSDNCQLDQNNQPYCNNCIGDLDGHGYMGAMEGCQSVACSASGTNFTVDNDSMGTWYSPGYNLTSTANSSVPANSNCVYNLPGTYQTPTVPILGCLESGNVQISFSSSDGSFTQTIASTTSKRALNSLLSKIPDGSLTLTSTIADPTFCVIQLQQTPTVAGVEVVEKKNGFFSWLMGY
ncbi:Protein CBG00470 [Caenorhabditis briggsae]|uniref:Protein CBG00470 n=1 Tax=Caenorhabditis briggsae TaxID=6238 RepID=A8WMQ8_CAEBR|nr:Protein CBG00470 [Caenorhabditis briggsae]CAP21763.2 Protein CBG00470 [Caenorhabditis briggsae]